MFFMGILIGSKATYNLQTNNMFSRFIKVGYKYDFTFISLLHYPWNIFKRPLKGSAKHIKIYIILILIHEVI